MGKQRALMANIAIGDLCDAAAGGWVTLNGAELMPGLAGAEVDLSTGDGERRKEVIKLKLCGSLPEMRAVVDQLNRLFDGLGPVGRPTRREICLRVLPPGEAGYVYSHILEAEWQSPAGFSVEFARGSTSLTLRLTREDWFDAERVALPISNTSAVAETLGLRVYNHDDGKIGHDNWFSVNVGALMNQRPYPLRLEISNESPGGLLEDLRIGSLLMDSSGSFPQLVLEAENGSHGTAIASTQASGGKYARISWSSAGWQTLTSWVISGVDVTKLGGRVLLPILRFFTPPVETGLGWRLVLSTAGRTAWEGPAQTGDAQPGYVTLNPMRLPGALVPLESLAAACTVSLQVFHVESGAHQVELDYLLLLPQETGTYYRSVTGLEQGGLLIDDSSRLACWSEAGDYELISHQKIGFPLMVYPGSEQRFYLFQVDGSQMAPIDRQVSVRAWYRERRRLP